MCIRDRRQTAWYRYSFFPGKLSHFLSPAEITADTPRQRRIFPKEFPVELIFLFITGTILLSFHKRSPVFSVPGGPLQFPFMKKYQFFLTVIVFCRRLESPVPLCQPGSFLRRIAENTYPAVSFFIKQPNQDVYKRQM